MLASFLAQLQCPACQRTLDDPTVLACGHNVCARCVTNGLSHSSTNTARPTRFVCPLCWAATEVSGAHSLPRNVQLRNVVAAIERSALEAARCLDCGGALPQQGEGTAAPLCTACQVELQARVEPGGPPSGSTPPGQLTRCPCPEHGVEMPLFCYTCRRPVCPLCLTGGLHRAHHCGPLAVALSPYASQSQQVAFLSKADAELSRLGALLDQARVQIMADYTRSVQTCEAAFQSFLQSLRSLGDAKLAEVQSQQLALRMLHRLVHDCLRLAGPSPGHPDGEDFTKCVKALAEYLGTAQISIPSAIGLPDAAVHSQMHQLGLWLLPPLSAPGAAQESANPGAPQPPAAHPAHGGTAHRFNLQLDLS